MKKLIITASPSTGSFTHSIANTILEKYNKSEIINLYDEKYKLDFLSFEDKKEIPKNDTIKFIQEKIISCEEIIFVFPVWWGGMPAIMKNMFDSVFISGFAFKYGTEGKEDLLVGKKGSVIATCDAPSKIYLENSNWTGINLKTYFEKSLFGFCGIEMNDFKLFGNFRSSNENEKISFLKKL